MRAHVYARMCVCVRSRVAGRGRKRDSPLALPMPFAATRQSPPGRPVAERNVTVSPSTAPTVSLS